MKIITNIFMSLIVGVFLFSCSSQNLNSSSQPKEKKGRDYSMYQNLAEVLRAQGTLSVLGTHPNVRVYTRGQSTIQLETQPLYIVDGTVIGNDYARAANAVNPINIASIQVVTDISRLTLYGTQANHGAIFIKTKMRDKY